VVSLFAVSGTSADKQLGLSGSTAKTLEGAYSVDISALALRSSVTGSQTAGLTITAGVNDQISLQVDGVSVNATLTPGAYASAAQLAVEVQTRINATTGVSVAVQNAAGILSITSNSFGSSSNVTISGGNGAVNLLGAAPVSQAGQDVSGTINGFAATGSGQTLTAGAGSPADGLGIRVTGGATGPRGTFTYTEGFAKRIDTYLKQVLGDSGQFTVRTDGINTSIKKLSDRQASLELRMSDIEKRYLRQFSALDAMISSMNTTSAYLTQQLAALNSNKSN
jgi:flagellar hook-associated protein 2